MSNYHVYHISFFDSMLNGLQQRGVSLDKFTNHSYISRFDLKNPNTYIPKEVAYTFFKNVKYRQGIDCFASEFYRGFQVNDLSDYGEYLSNCPDLHAVLLNIIKYDYQIQTHGKIQLKTEGALSWISMKHIDAPSQGREISERINAAMGLEAFQFILGKDWTPIALNITSSDGYWLQELIPSSNYKLTTNCDEFSICFKTSELATKNKNAFVQKTLTNVELKAIDSLTMKLFESLVGHYLPTLEELAAYFGYSKRTLIRAYAKVGTTYQELLDNYLFTTTLKLLQDSSKPIHEISYLLGYAHTSNFIRAFKRWTSTTPQQYRLQLSNL